MYSLAFFFTIYVSEKKKIGYIGWVHAQFFGLKCQCKSLAILL